MYECDQLPSLRHKLSLTHTGIFQRACSTRPLWKTGRMLRYADVC